MNTRDLASIIDNVLSKYGFDAKRVTWYRAVQGVLQVIDLQKSSYGGRYFINICCVPDGMSVDGMPAPKEHKCPIRIRLTSAFPDIRDELEKLLDLDNDEIDSLERMDRINSILNTKLIPFMENMKSNETLARSVNDGVFKRGAVSIKARQHLGLDISGESSGS
jgi:hypothetical protein